MSARTIISTAEQQPCDTARSFMMETSLLQRISLESMAIGLRHFLAGERCLASVNHERHEEIRIRAILPVKARRGSFGTVWWLRSLMERVNCLVSLSNFRLEEKNGYIDFRARMRVKP
jgi:hypothetical protein